MKKIILSILFAIIALPVVVFADTKVIQFHANENMFVNGYKEVWLEASGSPINTLHEIKLDFDTNYFSISKENISITACGKDITNYNNIAITISNGTISIKSTSDIDLENCIGSPDYVINLKFLALKAGTSNVRLYGDQLYGYGGGPIDVNLKSTITECPKCVSDEKECQVCKEKECPACEQTKCSNSDSRYFEALVIVIISCFGSVILLISVMILISVTKQKTMIKSNNDNKKKESKE